MTGKIKTAPLALILIVFITGAALAGSQQTSLDKVALSPLMVVYEYTGTPEHSDLARMAYKSNDAGLTWQRNEIKNVQGTIRSISCNKKSYCVGIGEAYSHNTTTLMAYISYDDGNNWTSHSLGVFGGSSGLESVTCDENQHCVAVGAATPVGKGGMQPIVFTSYNAGNTWAANYPEPISTWPSGSALRAVSCSWKENMNCVAVGNLYPDGKTTTFISYSSNDGGLHWSQQTIEDNQGVESLLTSISCNNGGKYCVAIGRRSLDFVGQPANHNIQSAMYETYDSGNTWARVNIPIDVLSNARLNQIICNSNSCIAIGTENHRPIVLKNESSGWLRIKPSILGSVYSIPVFGMEADPELSFSLKSAGLSAITCDVENVNCIAIGLSKYIVPLKKEKPSGVRKFKYITLPTFYSSSDAGNSWDTTWPSIIDKDHQLRAVLNDYVVAVGG